MIKAMWTSNWESEIIQSIITILLKGGCIFTVHHALMNTQLNCGLDNYMGKKKKLVKILSIKAQK